MQVDVFLTGQSVQEKDVAGRTAIVIDVFRASSTIVTALSNGAQSILPVADLSEAHRLADRLAPDTYLLCGERGGIKIDGYHLGNSPFEYTSSIIGGRTVILTTTNGTLALSRARSATHLIVGSFLNLSCVIQFAKEADRDVALICAGWRGRFSLEDTLCAGSMLHSLWDGSTPRFTSDSTYLTFQLYQNEQERLAETLTKCHHGQRLEKLGFASDVKYCIQQDKLPVVPIYQDKRLILAD